MAVGNLPGVAPAAAKCCDTISGAVSLDVTKLLNDWSRGNQSALDELTPLVYRDLHQRARNYLRRERPDHTLQPTALIHEAYLRLVTDSPSEWNGRAHFFAVASRVMRQILVDHARRHHAGKRGSGVADVSLDDALVPAMSDSTDLMELDEALSKLAAFDERKCRIVEMRYFGGLSEAEIAETLGLTERTVRRDWEKARLLLFAALK